ncbi:hypothetical protein HWV62_13739 [Athelia sp. TMB]|nr:hypothetical protein HWV62_13739 [Athelia sp. TMB]
MIISRYTSTDIAPKTWLAERSSNAKSNVPTFAGAIGGSVGVLALLALGLAINLCGRRFLSSRREARELEEPRSHANDRSMQSNSDNPPQMRETAATFIPRHFPEYVPNPIIQPPPPCALPLEEKIDIAFGPHICPPGFEGDVAQTASSPSKPGAGVPIPANVAPLLINKTDTSIQGLLTTEATIANPASDLRADCDVATISSSHYTIPPPVYLEREKHSNHASPIQVTHHDGSRQSTSSNPMDTPLFP